MAHYVRLIAPSGGLHGCSVAVNVCTALQVELWHDARIAGRAVDLAVSWRAEK